MNALLPRGEARERRDFWEGAFQGLPARLSFGRMQGSWGLEVAWGVRNAHRSPGRNTSEEAEWFSLARE